MIQKLIFPSPKTSLDDKTRKKIIYIPVFSNKVSYGILNSFFEASTPHTVVKSFGQQYCFTQSTIESNLGADFDDNDHEDELTISDIKHSVVCFQIETSNNTNQEFGRMSFKRLPGKSQVSRRVIEKDDTFLQQSGYTCDFRQPIKTQISSLVNSQLMSTAKKLGPNFNIKDKSNVSNDSLSVLDSKILLQTFQHTVPCLYYSFKTSDRYLIYFHSNGEDISQLRILCKNLAQNMESNVIIVEYPGYSIYGDKQSNVNSVCSDAEKVVDFLMETCKISLSRIIVMGRSIGSGPAVHLSSLHRFGLLVLITPFLSIKEIVKDKLRFFSNFVDCHFNNAETIKLNRTPLLLVHGKNDELINFRHSEQLYALAKSKAKLVIYDEMPHNKFNFFDCVIEPTIKYLEALKICLASDMSRQDSMTQRLGKNEKIKIVFQKPMF